jgi:chlorite dismutase
MDNEIKTMVITYRFNESYWAGYSEMREGVTHSLVKVSEDLEHRLINFRSYESMRWDSDIIFWFSSRNSEDLVHAKKDLNIAFKGLASSEYSMFAIYEH